MKKRERNGVSKEYFILSVRRFAAKIWHLKVWDIANSPWNLDLNSKCHKIWKIEKGMAFLRHILFGLSDVLLQRYDSANRRPIWKKSFSHSWQLYTVTQAAHVFGWWWGVEGGPAYVGWPRIKRSLYFLKHFLESQNHREKLILWGRNWVHWQGNFLKEDKIFFWIFWHLRHFRVLSLWKKQGPFRPWPFWWGLTAA